MRAAGTAGGRKVFAFALVRDFTLSAFALFVDALRLAGDERDRSRRVRFDWRVISGSDLPCRSSSGVDVLPTARASAPVDYDYVVVVGGLVERGLVLDTETQAFVLRSARAGVPIVGLCTGSFVLAEMGLLDGRRAAVSWLHLDAFRRRYPHIEATAEHLYLIDGDRITCSGGVSSADLAVALIESEVGLAPVRKAAEILQMDGVRSPTALQPRRPLADGRISDRRLQHALVLMDQSIDRPLPVAAIARRVGCSPRHLERLFALEIGTSPRRAYLQLRLDRAKQLLVQTELQLHEIADRTGFADQAQFSRMVSRAFGAPPTAIRRTRRVG